MKLQIFIIFASFSISTTDLPSCASVGKYSMKSGSGYFVCPKQAEIHITVNPYEIYPYNVICKCNDGSRCQECSWAQRLYNNFVLNFAMLLLLTTEICCKF